MGLDTGPHIALPCTCNVMIRVMVVLSVLRYSDVDSGSLFWVLAVTGWFRTQYYGCGDLISDKIQCQHTGSRSIV